jgi:hypothetical protein
LSLHGFFSKPFRGSLPGYDEVAFLKSPLGNASVLTPGYAAIHAVAAQLGLHGRYPGQKAGGAYRAAKGFGDGGEEQPDGEQVFGVAGKISGAGLMPTRDRVSSPAQILRQIHFHLDGRFKRHWVQVLVQFWQKAEAVTLDY